MNRTAVRSSAETDALVLEHEVTLYRDPVTFDFGILLGEDPVTGRAYVTDIRPTGPAHKSAVIKKYDRIVEVIYMIYFQISFGNVNLQCIFNDFCDKF